MNTQNTYITWIVGVLAVAAIIGVGVWYSMSRVEAPTDTDVIVDVSTSTPATTTPSTGTNTSGTTATTSTSGSAAQTAATKKAQFDAAMTKGDAAYKAGNYQQARISWEAAAKIDPTGYNVFASLGQLYAVNIKDNAKAELNYLMAIKNTPAPYSAPLYRTLYDFYKSTNRDFSAIERMLKDSIARTPAATEFYVLLAREYKAMQLFPEARVQYDAAIAAAGTNTTLVSQLQAERNSF